jgi:hypothetical protein
MRQHLLRPTNTEKARREYSVRSQVESFAEIDYRLTLYFSGRLQPPNETITAGGIILSSIDSRLNDATALSSLQTLHKVEQAHRLKAGHAKIARQFPECRP